MPNSTFDIRDARPEDLEQVSFLLRDAYREYEIFMPAETWQAYLAEIMDVRSRLPESELVVAEAHGELVGTVTLYLNANTVQHWPAGWAGIRLLAVQPSHRGEGIGRALMEECLKRCREKGIFTIGLHTTDMMSVARRMYERMGFVRVPKYDFNAAPGVLVMAYLLQL